VNPRMLPRFVALLGKLIQRYDIMATINQFEEHERDLLRLAKTEYDFYHSHETAKTIDAIKEPSPKSAGRATLSLSKTPR
jgi:hypothetical protein